MTSLVEPNDKPNITSHATVNSLSSVLCANKESVVPCALNPEKVKQWKRKDCLSIKTYQELEKVIVKKVVLGSSCKIEASTTTSEAHSSASKTLLNLSEDSVNPKTYEPITFTYNECSLAALSHWAAERYDADIRNMSKLVYEPTVIPECRKCSLCSKWGHYDIECTEISSYDAMMIGNQIKMQHNIRNFAEFQYAESMDVDRIKSPIEKGPTTNNSDVSLFSPASPNNRTRMEGKPIGMEIRQRKEKPLLQSDLIHKNYDSGANIDLKKCIHLEECSKITSCQVCKSGMKAEDMLICDGCDDLYHMQCLDPPLLQIPEGDWFCMDCTRYDSDLSSVIDIEEFEDYVFEQCKQPMSGSFLHGTVIDDWNTATIVTGPLKRVEPCVKDAKQCTQVVPCKDATLSSQKPSLAKMSLFYGVKSYPSDKFIPSFSSGPAIICQECKGYFPSRKLNQIFHPSSKKHCDESSCHMFLPLPWGVVEGFKYFCGRCRPRESQKGDGSLVLDKSQFGWDDCIRLALLNLIIHTNHPSTQLNSEPYHISEGILMKRNKLPNCTLKYHQYFDRDDICHIIERDWEFLCGQRQLASLWRSSVDAALIRGVESNMFTVLYGEKSKKFYTLLGKGLPKSMKVAAIPAYVYSAINVCDPKTCMKVEEIVREDESRKIPVYSQYNINDDLPLTGNLCWIKSKSRDDNNKELMWWPAKILNINRISDSNSTYSIKPFGKKALNVRETSIRSFFSNFTSIVDSQSQSPLDKFNKALQEAYLSIGCNSLIQAQMIASLLSGTKRLSTKDVSNKCVAKCWIQNENAELDELDGIPIFCISENEKVDKLFTKVPKPKCMGQEQVLTPVMSTASIVQKISSNRNVTTQQIKGSDNLGLKKKKREEPHVQESLTSRSKSYMEKNPSKLVGATIAINTSNMCPSVKSMENNGKQHLGVILEIDSPTNKCLVRYMPTLISQNLQFESNVNDNDILYCNSGSSEWIGLNDIILVADAPTDDKICSLIISKDSNCSKKTKKRKKNLIEEENLKRQYLNKNITSYTKSVPRKLLNPGSSPGIFHAEGILDSRRMRIDVGGGVWKTRVQYLVKWIGFPEDDASWEPMSNILNVGLIQKFKEKKKEMKKKPVIPVSLDGTSCPFCNACYPNQFSFWGHMKSHRNLPNYREVIKNYHRT